MINNFFSVRNIILGSAYLCVMIVFYTFGYGVGFSNGGGMITEAVSAPAPTTAASPMPSTRTEQYRLTLEDEELRLYHDEGGISRLITEEAISQEVFPQNDIDMLEEGIKFDSEDKAAAMMENFLS